MWLSLLLNTRWSTGLLEYAGMLDSIVLWALTSTTSPAKVWEYSVKAEESRLYQFGRISNPSVGYDYDADYHILGLSQEVSNPWLLKAHRRIGEGRTRMADIRRAEDSLRFVLYLKDRYYDLLLILGRLHVEEERLSALEELIGTVDRGVRVGRFPVAHLDALKARREHLRGRITLLVGEHTGILSSLSLLTGRDIRLIEDSLTDPPSLPGEDTLLLLLRNSPAIRLKLEEVRLAEAEVSYQRSRVFPGFGLSAGIFRYRDRPAGGITAGLTFPLPVFNTNIGNYRASEYLLKRAKADVTFTNVRLAGEVLLLARTYNAIRKKLKRMKDVEIPALERAYTSTVKAYVMGAVGYTEVLSALDALYEAHAERYEIRRRAFALLSRLESLLNTELRR